MSRRTILIGLVLVALLGGLLLFVSCGRQEAPAEPAPTPSVDPYAADRKALQEYSAEFAQKFFTYNRPDDPSYLASIQPYMTEAFFAENKRLTEGEPIALANTTPVTSTVISTEAQLLSDSSGEVAVTINSKTSSSQFRQTAYILWQKTDGRWSVSGVRIGSTVEE